MKTKQTPANKATACWDYDAGYYDGKAGRYKAEAAMMSVHADHYEAGYTLGQQELHAEATGTK